MSGRIGMTALVSLLLGAAVALPARVSAHAHYDHSSPGIGEVLAVAPARVDIYTDQELRKTADANRIAVVGAQGAVDDGQTIVDDSDRRHFSVGLRPNLPAGRYVVSFQTLSDADGDRDHGRFAFYIGTGPTAAQKAADAQLTGTATSGGSGSSSPPLLILVVAAIAALAVAGAALMRVRRGNRRH